MAPPAWAVTDKAFCSVTNVHRRTLNGQAVSDLCVPNCARGLLVAALPPAPGEHDHGLGSECARR